MASDTSLDVQQIENEHRTVGAPTWIQWVEENSKPKKLKLPACKPRKLTPWQKRGPMTRKDWVHFYKWAAKKALPKTVKLPDPEPEPPCEKWRKPHKPRPLQQRLENIENLCRPKNPVEKYDSDDPEDELTFNPVIKWGTEPHRDAKRPYVPLELPVDFQHIEVELDFWYEARFPVKPAALSYKASPNIKRLANPKVIYLELLHCPYPFPEVEYVEPRRRFTNRQWRQHQRRLEYLARPVSRPYWDYDY